MKILSVLKNNKYAIFLFFWLIFVAVMSLASFSKNTMVDLPKIKNLDKFAHFVFYFVLTILLMKFFKEETSQMKQFLKRAIVSTFIAFGVGVLMEFLQSYLTTTRSADINDVYFNMLGVISAIIIPKLIKISNLI